jgi:hypothetical protein
MVNVGQPFVVAPLDGVTSTGAFRTTWGVDGAGVVGAGVDGWAGELDPHALTIAIRGSVHTNSVKRMVIGIIPLAASVWDAPRRRTCVEGDATAGRRRSASN